jgi:hypothetical protein
MSKSRLGPRGLTWARAAVAALASITFFTANGWAQEKLTEHTFSRSPGAPGPAAQVEDMAWLAGHWVGEALGGTVEEIWSPPLARAMMGMFRLVKDEKAVFYELMTILEEDGSLVLRLKHFNGGDLSAWEEKGDTVDFPLVAVVDGTFRFDGMSFHPEGDDRVAVYLAMHGKEGAVEEVDFIYTRVREKSATTGSTDE